MFVLQMLPVGRHSGLQGHAWRSRSTRKQVPLTVCSPAVDVAGGAIPQADSAVPKVPAVSHVGAEADSALEGHGGIHQSRGSARKPAGHHSPLHLDMAGLRGHTAHSIGSLDHHAVPGGTGRSGGDQRQVRERETPPFSQGRRELAVICRNDGRARWLRLTGQRGDTLTSLSVMEAPVTAMGETATVLTGGTRLGLNEAEWHLRPGLPGSKAPPSTAAFRSTCVTGPQGSIPCEDDTTLCQHQLDTCRLGCASHSCLW